MPRAQIKVYGRPEGDDLGDPFGGHEYDANPSRSVATLFPHHSKTAGGKLSRGQGEVGDRLPIMTTGVGVVRIGNSAGMGRLGEEIRLVGGAETGWGEQFFYRCSVERGPGGPRYSRPGGRRYSFVAEWRYSFVAEWPNLEL